MLFIKKKRRHITLWLHLVSFKRLKSHAEKLKMLFYLNEVHM